MANYPMPGYLEHTADLAGNLLGGFRAGAAVAQEQAQLQAQSDRTNVELQMRERENERQAARQQQMLEMTRAYHEQMTNLRATQLKTAQQRVNLATQQAARRYQAQKEYQDYAQSLGGAPEDYGKAALRFGPEMGMAAGPMAAALRGGGGAKAYGAVQTTDLPGGYTAAFRQGSPGFHVLNPPKPPPSLTPAQLASSITKLRDLEMQMRTPGVETNLPLTYQGYQWLKGAVNQVPGGAAAAGAQPSARLQRARELRKLHPDWSKQQVLDELNAEHR